jgi:ParB family chromosome partitioning protein
LAFDRQEPEITAFDGAMAEKFDLGRSTIKDAVAIWEGLSAPSRAALRGTALAEKKTELKALSKESRARQAKILALILDPAHPDIQNVAEALFHLENGITPNMVERRYLAATKTLGSLDDVLFDRVIMAQEERVIASLKRRGRI